MTEEEFRKRLNQEQTKEEKIECLQHYLDNHPVRVNVGFSTDWSRLDVKITGGSDELVNKAFNSLKNKQWNK
jgi:hypothetical protein